MIQFTCPGCNKTLKAPAEKAGVAVRCPQCQQQLNVPSPAPEKAAANIGEAHKPVAPPPPPAPTAEQWYFTRNGEQQGPVTIEQLKQRAVSRQLQPTDMVWKQGMAQWIQASTITNLFDQVSPPALPAVPTERPPAAPGALAVPAAHSPVELKAPVVATFVVSGLALAFGVVGLLLPDVRTGTRVLAGLALAHNIATVVLTLNIIRLRNYALSQVTPWLVMTSWTWHWLTNPLHGMTLLGMILAISVGVWCLLVLRRPDIRVAFDADPPLPPLFSLGRWWLKQSLLGKWVPANENDQQLEIAASTITLGNKQAETYTLLSNNRLEITCGQSVAVWTLIKVDTTELVVRNHQGETKVYKRYNPLSNLFTVTKEDERRWRLTYLQHKWEPVSGNGPAIQFTQDGAFIRFDGVAARYSFDGEPPNEIVTIHINDTEAVQLKVLSLERDEMVLVGDGGSCHYKRGVSITEAEAKRRAAEFNAKMKKLGKAALLTVGAIGAGIAVLGVAAAAAGAGGGGGGTGPRPARGLETHCEDCKSAVDTLAKRCPYCGSTNIWKL